MKKLSFIAILQALLITACAFSPADLKDIQRRNIWAPGLPEPSNPRVNELRELDKQKRFSEMLTMLFPEAIKNGKLSTMTREVSEQDFFWLRSETVGPPPTTTEFPLYYFFSWKLAFPDVAAARKMNARGRVALFIASSICIRESQFSTPWVALVEGGVFDNMKLRTEPEWSAALDEAISWHASAVPWAKSKEWFCGSANTISQNELNERYSGILQKLRLANRQNR